MHSIDLLSAPLVYVLFVVQCGIVLPNYRHAMYVMVICA